MALIFFQIAPVHTVSSLWGTVYLALSVKFRHCIFIFLAAFPQGKYAQNRLTGSDFRRDLMICRQLLDTYRYRTVDASSLAKTKHQKIFFRNFIKSYATINQQMQHARFILTIVQHCVHKGKINWYCRFILVFQVINYLTRSSGT